VIEPDAFWWEVFEDAVFNQGMSHNSAMAYADEWEDWLIEDAQDRLLREWEAIESIESTPLLSEEDFLRIVEENAIRWKAALELLAR
jgi:hypothetical protein